MSLRRVFARRAGDRQVARIDVTNLIDIMMILLIFSIVSASFVKESGVAVERPQSSQAMEVSATFVPVAILKSGTVVIAGHVLPFSAVEAATAHALAESACLRVVVQADREAPVGLLLNVMDAARRAGARQVDVAAQRPERTP